MDYLSKEMKQLQHKTLIKHGKTITRQHKHWLDFIKVKDIPGICPHRIAFEKILNKEDLSTYDEAMMYNHCKHSIFAAAKRQMKKAPKPTPEVAEDFVKFAISILEGTCPYHLRNNKLTEKLKHFSYSYNQWYQHNTAVKQKDIDEYFESLEDATKFTEKRLKELQSTTYKGICKQELQPVDGKSRMVCSIPIKTKITMGPVTWKLEEIMAHHFPGYCGNKNLQQMSDAINNILALGFTKIVEGDGSAFDNTQDVSLKEVDRYLYRMIADKVYHVPKQQFLDISQALYKTMSVEYIQNKKKKTMFTYSILGSVFSGDCDTTLCNTMRMALYNIYVNEKAGLKYGQDYMLFSKGDDFTVFYKPTIDDDFIRQLYYKYFIRGSDVEDTSVYGLGQVLKFMTIGGPETISFCSLRAFYRNENEDDIILVRDFKKFLNISKYSRKIKSLSGINRIAYLYQQAISMEVAYGGIHIFDIMAQAYRQEAYNYAKYCTKHNDRRLKEILHKAKTLANKNTFYERKAFSKHVLETQNEILFYDIRGKKEKNKRNIKGMSPWEQIKYYQEKCSYNLTKHEYEYINQQIHNEIFCEEFKATMGLKNESYQ